MISNTYRYTISMNWVNGEETIPIQQNRISSLVIDYDYERANMPVMMITMKLSRNFIDKIILNKVKSKFFVSIDKFKEDNIDFKKKYIRGEFIYFISKDINYSKNIDYTTSTNVDSTEEDKAYKVTIGLFNIEFINSNKQTINAIYKDATRSEIILLNTRHANLIMEPFSNDIRYDEILIPPVNSISQLLKYLNNINSLYDTPYRYFIDFDENIYLMSSKGNPIATNTDNNTDVNIRIKDPRYLDSKVQGIIYDESANSHILDVSAENTKVKINNAQDKLYNRIITIDGNGNTQRIDLDINRDPAIKDLDLFIKINNLNANAINIIKKESEKSSINVLINKSNIDSSAFTMNKRYYINHFDSYKNLNGNYIINDKKEIFVLNGDSFKINIVCNFYKI